MANMYSRKLKFFTCGKLHPPDHKNEMLWSLVLQAVSAFKCVLSNFNIARLQVIGFFKTEKIVLEVFLNFFPCV